jgi:hypothetical protein
MTQAESEIVQIVHRAHICLRALLETRRLTTAYLSSLTSTANEGGQHEATGVTAKAIIRGQSTESATAVKERVAPGSGTVAGVVDGGAGQDNRSGGAR